MVGCRLLSQAPCQAGDVQTDDTENGWIDVNENAIKHFISVKPFYQLPMWKLLLSKGYMSHNSNSATEDWLPVALFDAIIIYTNSYFTKMLNVKT